MRVSLFTLSLAAVSAAPSESQRWYVPGTLPFVTNVSTSRIHDWQDYTYSVSSGPNACPKVKLDGIPAVYLTESAYPEGVDLSWICLNLISGDLSYELAGKVATAHPTECDYLDALSMTEQLVSYSKETAPALVKYMSAFRPAWVKQSTGLACNLKSVAGSGELTPTSFTVNALGNQSHELVAELADMDGKVLSFARVPLRNSDADQSVHFSTPVSGLSGRNTVLNYGVVIKGAPLSKAIHKYAIPYYFVREDVYKVNSAHLVRGRTATLQIEYNFDFEHILRVYATGEMAVVSFVARHTENTDIAVPKGKGTLDLISEGILFRDEFLPGKNYTVTVRNFANSGLLNQPQYPDFVIPFTSKNPLLPI